MRKKLLALSLGLICFSHFNVAARAIPLLPVGAYTLTAMTENNPGVDVGTVSGKLFFDDSSKLTFADIAFNDFTIGKIFTFTVPGPSFVMTSPEITGAEVFNEVDPNPTRPELRQYFDLFVGFPSDPSGIFALSGCGVPRPCGTVMHIDLGGLGLTFVRVRGEITPIPEPGTFMLLGTGALAIFGSRRDSFSSDKRFRGAGCVTPHL
jgi:hypothetical protein